MAKLLALASLGGILACASLTSLAQGLSDSPLRAALRSLPERIVEGEPFWIEIEVGNPGPESPMSRATFRPPPSLRLAARPDCGGLPGWKYEPEGRQWVSEGRWAPGETRSCRIRLLAPEDQGSAVLAIDVATFAPDSYGGVQLEMPMVGRPAPGRTVFQLGSYRVRALELAVLVFAGLFFGSLLLGRLAGGRRRQTGLAGASGYNFFAFGVLCLGFLTYFVFLAREDARSLSDYRETRCEVFDSDVEVFRHRAERGKKETTSFDARLVVGYELDGQNTIALAGRPASFLDLSAEKAQALLASLDGAETIPCWVDPADRSQVLIDRGYGGAYFFALIPFGGLLLLGWLYKK